MFSPHYILFGDEALICGLTGSLGGILYYTYWMVGALGERRNNSSSLSPLTKISKFLLLMSAGFVVGIAVWWWFCVEAVSGQITVEKVAVISFALGLAGVSASKILQKLIAN